MGRFKEMTDDEVYILLRQAVESSFNIVMSGRYNKYECKLHKDLMNELIDELKKRE